MCGIIGVYGQTNAASLAQLGLFSLQHRGQESAGIVAVDGPTAVVRRKMGLVSDAITATELADLPGSLAIGHTRYSTAGTSTIDNAQPVLVHLRRGDISLAHNGNLTNAELLRDKLEATGSIFGSTMDSEVIVHQLAKVGPGKPEEMLAEALKGLEGAYSLVVTIGNCLLGARDPHGWRPLVMGRVGDAIVFASETCALDIMGAKVVRDVEPGEIIAVDADGVRSIKPFPPTPQTRCVFEYVYFARPDSAIFGGSVDRARRGLGRALAREAPAPGADLVFAVP
ncbi:MAG TPA: class II glutamine amidotransferase, partial [Gemmatimonadaceae bacterium]|nr:class II glutamine amidotransferase [Gemmatimonadaceae bacterium]